MVDFNLKYGTTANADKIVTTAKKTRKDGLVKPLDEERCLQ